jgi:CheY-like chemotaxis protein
MANLLQFNLKRAGFDTVAVSNGASGLETASERGFDMIITDHQLPGLSGIEMCKALRQLPQYTATPVLLCTAKGLELQLSTLQEEYGVTDTLFKPVSPRQLVSAVGDLLSSAIASC